MNLALEHQIERKTYWISLYSDFNKAFSFFDVLDKFFTKSLKKYLDEILSYAEELELEQQQILGLERKQLEKELLKLKSLNRLFDKLHDKFHSANYFDDAEIRILFKLISRKLHKTENLVDKYFSKDLPFKKTPDYIKNQLAEFSKEAISKSVYK